MALLEQLNKLTAQNIFLDENTGGKGRYFKSRFLQAGLVKYSFGVCILSKETIDKFVDGFVGCPVIINHKDVTNESAKDDRVGVISRVWYDEKDGWFWCEGVIFDEEAISLIESGYNVSCQYEITEYSNNTTKALHNGNPYDKVILNGKPEHLAIVKTPRYESAMIAVNALEIEMKAENEAKWITIHPNGEDGKGRHLLLKDGESPKEAIERTYGKGLKSDTKDGSKDISKEEHAKIKEQVSKMSDDELVKAHFESQKGYESETPRAGSMTKHEATYGEVAQELKRRTGRSFSAASTESEIKEALSKAKSDTKDKQSESKGEKKYNYTLTKREVEGNKMLGGMADTGNYYTNGSFAIDKNYLNIKGQEPKKMPDIDSSVKKMFTETAKQKQKEENYVQVKDFESGELINEHGRPIKVDKYSYFDEKYGYTKEIFVNSKYNNLFKNFDLKFGGEYSPIYAYDGKDLVGILMPIISGKQSYKKAENELNEEEDINNENQISLFDKSKSAKHSIIQAINELKENNMFNKLFNKKEKAMELNKDEMKELFIDCIQDVLKAQNEAEKEEVKEEIEKEEKAENKKACNEDKRKLIDEVAGMMKSAGCDDEVIRTAIAKMEKIGYDKSEVGTADNGKKAKCEDEEEKEEALNKAKNSIDALKGLLSQSEVRKPASKYITKSQAIELGNQLF